MSETQHQFFLQEQAHFIQSGTRSAKDFLHDFLDAINSTNMGHAKAHALWPLLRCVAVARCRCRCRCVVLGGGGGRGGSGEGGGWMGGGGGV